MKGWRIHEHGGPEVLRLEDLPDPDFSSLKDHEAWVRVEAVGLNHLDLWARKGVPGHSFPLPLILGSDVVGQERVSGRRVLVYPVSSCGVCPRCLNDEPYLCSRFSLMGESHDGGLTEWVRVPRGNLIPLPDSESWTWDPIDAAALPIAFTTALSMLRRVKLESGQWILIQAAGSGVSSAAIQMAKLLGAKVLATAGTEVKRQLARGLGAVEVFDSRSQNLFEELKAFMKAEGRRGVDVALDHVGKATFETSLRLLDGGGCLVTCGATTGAQVSLDLKRLFFKSLSIVGSTMGSQDDLRQVVQWVEERKIRPLIHQVFDFQDLPKAHAELSQGQVFGKVVIRCSS